MHWAIVFKWWEEENKPNFNECINRTLKMMSDAPMQKKMSCQTWHVCKPTLQTRFSLLLASNDAMRYNDTYFPTFFPDQISFQMVRKTGSQLRPIDLMIFMAGQFYALRKQTLF